MRSYIAHTNDIKRQWFILDAKDKILGRFATKVARLLIGKDKPTFTPHVDQGDFVIVLNADKIKVTGKKLENKIYYHHTFYPGGLKQKQLKDILSEKPERIIELAVKRMLPKNRMQARRMRRLKIYVSEKHPHLAQSPTLIS